jgi:hypothetical protein
MPEDIHDDQPNDYAYGNDLSTQRPSLRQAHLYCVKCRHQPYMLETTAQHAAGRNGLPTGEGVLLARVHCHGEMEEMAILFSQLNVLLNSGEKIPVFDSVNRYELKRIIVPGQHDLLDR